MSDDRTPEQRQADDDLTAAVEANLRALGWAGGYLSDYMVLTVQQSWTDDGDHRLAYGVIYRDGELSHDRILGLLRMATLRAERQFLEADS